jgi:6-phosphofructokinase 2
VSAIVTLTLNPALDIATSTPRVAPAEKLRCAEPRYDPGGGGINVARAVHQLGGDALAIFPAGGLSGEMLCRLIDSRGVARVTVPVDGITRENLTIVEEESGKQYRFLLPGAKLRPDDQQRCLDEVAKNLPGARYLVASGSLPPGVPPSFYADVGALARRHGVPFVLDTSGPALADAALTDLFLLKVSRSELEQAAGHPLETMAEREAAARQIVASGRARVVVVSQGDQGALLATKTGVQHFEAIAVEAVGSVGAGDSMVAGLVLALTRGLSLVEAVIFGIAAGTAALLRPGTELCRRQDVERLYAEAGCAAAVQP